MQASTPEEALPEARDIAFMLARFACNNHTITDEAGDPIGWPCIVCSILAAPGLHLATMSCRAWRRLHAANASTILMPGLTHQILQ